MCPDLIIQEQLDYLCKGLVEVIRLDELRARLERSYQTRKAMRVKAGFDPSAPDLHLGHTVLLRKMRHFQDLGHTVIFLIGDFTGLIGDPSGRNVTRKQLTKEEVLQNAQTYKQQVFRILDPEKTVLEFNSRWMSPMKSEDFIFLASRYTLARVLERDEFANRLRTSQPISVHEILYPLIQGYDSVALEADVELGGTDQKFNLLVGRELQKEYGQEPQIVLTTPILEGLDGIQKMSKSLDNYVGINAPPKEMFGKIMSINDELMYRYYLLCTDLTVGQIEQIRRDVIEGRKHPMAVKADLAKSIIKDFHSTQAANEAEEEFNRVVRQHLAPMQIEERVFPVSTENIRLPKLIAQLGLASSVAEAIRLMEQEAVTLDNEKVTNPKVDLDLSRPTQYTLKVGKRRYTRISVEEGAREI
jgi:tyrosyl-tRNA synthetase